METLITILITILITAIVTAVTTVFVYRNNVKTIGRVADKVDGIHDIVKEE
jgi:phosphotransferase system  glucose/maltose/N-acetylglucosamine-specific IIC component